MKFIEALLELIRWCQGRTIDTSNHNIFLLTINHSYLAVRVGEHFNYIWDNRVVEEDCRATIDPLVPIRPNGSKTFDEDLSFEVVRFEMGFRQDEKRRKDI